MPDLTNKQIKEIAEQLDCGFRAFYHRLTSELLFVPDTLKHYEIDKSAWKEEFDKLKKNSGDYTEIEAPESSDSFEIMVDFTELLDKNNPLKLKLTSALTKKKPFREFKFVIDNSGDYRQKWFDYKNFRLEEWVKSQIS
jgi:hypothetical protein